MPKIKTFGEKRSKKEQKTEIKAESELKEETQLKISVTINRVFVFIPKTSQKSGNFGINVADLAVLIKKRDFFVDSSYSPKTSVIVDLSECRAEIGSSESRLEGAVSCKTKVNVRGNDTKIKVF